MAYFVFTVKTKLGNTTIPIHARDEEAALSRLRRLTHCRIVGYMEK